MTSGRGRNVAASVRARLLDLARDRGLAFDYILNRYAVERLLYRLSISARRNELVRETRAHHSPGNRSPCCDRPA